MAEVTIRINKGGKRFLKEWIFRNVNLTIEQGERWAVLGGNGSGKSTFLQTLSGYQGLSEGELIWEHKNTPLRFDEYKNYFSWASPYLELPEELFPEEIIQHQAIYKPFLEDLRTETILEILYLNDSAGKRIRYFSSGMKQRLKLGLAILADAPVLLLDEPVSNLDVKAKGWYSEMIRVYAAKKTIIVCSNNIQEEIAFTNKTINIDEIKK
jgi:ABC-type multidrug transport system ATPase subunit